LSQTRNASSIGSNSAAGAVRFMPDPQIIPKLLPDGAPLIAVVDDDSAVRESFSVLLNGVGYLVKTYASGLELLQELPRTSTQCVLAATHLADLSGPQLLERIHEVGNGIPTLLMANHSREIPALSTLAPNLVGLLLKPVEEADLLTAIEAAIQLGTA
jgi:FixJ family two-component response regulator